MVDHYYSLARTAEKLDRKSLAVFLRQLHQQAVAEALDKAASLAAEKCPELESDIRLLHVSGKQLADNRLFLRRLEAILYTMLDVPRVTLKSQVAQAFNSGNGVDVVASGPNTLKIERQEGKY